MRTPNKMRLLKAFDCEPAETVPVWDYLIMRRNVEAVLGREISGTSNWTIPPSDYVELCYQAGMDALMVKLIWNGVPGPNEPDSARGKITNKTMMSLLETPPSDQEIESCIREYKEAIQDTDLGLGVIVRSVLCNTYESMGMENFMFALYDDRNLVEEVMDFYLGYSLRAATIAAKMRVDFFCIDDDVAMKSGLLISPTLLDELWMPRTRRILEPVVNAEIPIIMHCCGNLTDMIPRALSLGVRAIHPIEPYSNDIYSLKAQYAGKLCLIGNIDIAGVLAFGTPEEVEADTLEHLLRLSPGGGYVVGSSHSIIDAVPPENFRAMLETTHQFCRI